MIRFVVTMVTSTSITSTTTAMAFFSVVFFITHVSPTVPGVVSLRMCVARPSRGVVGAGAAVSRTGSARTRVAAIWKNIFGGCVRARAVTSTTIKIGRIREIAFLIILRWPGIS